LSRAAFLYGPETHHLDHLAPLCDLLGIPLIVTEESIALLAKRYYPMVDVILYDYLSVAETVVQNFDQLFYSMPRPLFDEIFFFAEQFLKKKVRTIWCPHGNSDKGHNSFFMEALQKEEAALLYGEKMIDFLKKKQAFHQLKSHVALGNFRYTFFKRHALFYRQLVDQEITDKLPPASKTLLYAPTWQDCEKSSSFFSATPHLIQKLPRHSNLIIKLHPNLPKTHPEETEMLIEQHSKNPNILFLHDFSPIYPLLEKIDIYIGDMSSIGYDFLTFNRPLFFLNQNLRDPKTDLGLYLFRCGTSIAPQDYPHIYQIIEQIGASDFAQEQKELHAYTFGREKEWNLLRQEIENSFTNGHICHAALRS
jgi:hypothetical protein